MPEFDVDKIAISQLDERVTLRAEADSDRPDGFSKMPVLIEHSSMKARQSDDSAISHTEH